MTGRVSQRLAATLEAAMVEIDYSRRLRQESVASESYAPFSQCVCMFFFGGGFLCVRCVLIQRM